MRYANLVEFRPDGVEPELFVEAKGGHLSVQVDLPETVDARLFNQVHHDGSSNSLAAVLCQHCDAADLTDGVKSASANRVTVLQPGQNMPTMRVVLIPLLGLSNALLKDKDLASDALEFRPVGLPGSGVERDGRGGLNWHFYPDGRLQIQWQRVQISLANRTASPR